MEHLPALLSGIALPAMQPLEGAVPQLPARTPDMGVIDWTRPGRVVHDWVRALTLPCSGAFSKLGGNRVMIWATRLPSPREPVGPPGEVIGFDRGGMRIGVRGGSIVVSRMSYPDSPPAPAALWCRVNGIDVGARFELVSADRAAWARGAGMERRSVS
jgi:methionyl-tRNA formyltransferase